MCWNPTVSKLRGQIKRSLSGAKSSQKTKDKKAFWLKLVKETIRRSWDLTLLYPTFFQMTRNQPKFCLALTFNWCHTFAANGDNGMFESRPNLSGDLNEQAKPSPWWSYRMQWCEEGMNIYVVCACVCARICRMVTVVVSVFVCERDEKTNFSRYLFLLINDQWLSGDLMTTPPLSDLILS